MESVALLLSLVIFIAAPALIYRYGTAVLALCGLAALALAILLFPSPDYFPVVLQPCILGIIAGISFRFGKSFQFYLISATLSIASALSAQYLFLKYAMNIDLAILIEERLLEMLRLYTLPEESKNLFMGEVERAVKIFSGLFPFTYFTNTLIWSSISWPILRFIFNVFPVKGVGNSSLELKGIDNFRLNDYTVFVLIFSLASIAFFMNKPQSLPFLAGVNIALACMMFYFVQAIGILRFFIKQKKLPSFALPIILIVLMVILVPGTLLPVLVIISAWGLFDLWIDFRKISVHGRVNKGD